MCGNHPAHRKHGSIGQPTLNMRVVVAPWFGFRGHAIG